ncbi:hypothetical protein, partial [Liquorilactobacillus cacaonum]|uniref:hypothetical protein n=1 Tax=Liquorilactobacillus cacaonum TaxID=483012 RepID=UPI001F20F16C
KRPYTFDLSKLCSVFKGLLFRYDTRNYYTYYRIKSQHIFHLLIFKETIFLTTSLCIVPIVKA